MLRIKYELNFRGLYSHDEVVLIDSAQPELMLALVLIKKLDNSSTHLQSDCLSSYVKTFPDIRNHEIRLRNTLVENIQLSQCEIDLLENNGVSVVSEFEISKWFEAKLQFVLTNSEFQGSLVDKSVLKSALTVLMDFNKSLPIEVCEHIIKLLEEPSLLHTKVA